jgi:hypothetical protein
MLFSKGIFVLIVVLGALMGEVSAAQSPTAVALTTSDIRDVVELFKFVQSAKPGLFHQFAGSFENLGEACSRSSYSGDLAKQVETTIDQIEVALPASNKSLLRKIKLALAFGGESVYRPSFGDGAHVRENISKFMMALRNAYNGKDFEECTRLVSAGLSFSPGETLVWNR